MRKFIPLVLLWAFFSFAGGEHGHEHGKEDHGEIDLSEDQMKQLGIETQKVSKERIGRIIKVPAEVRENLSRSFSVSSPVSGVIRKLYVREGDKVNKGQVIAEIYSPEVADLISNLRSSRVKTQALRKIYERDKELYEQKVIPYSRYFSSMVEYERSLGETQALEERLKSLGEFRNFNLLITAPADGYVVTQMVVEGEGVDTSTELFEIHDHHRLWVYGYFKEEDINLIKRGITAYVVFRNSRIPCKIDYIGHEVDEKTRRVKVRCVAENEDHLLRPGMFVSLEVTLGKAKGIIIPKSAVQEIEGTPTVFVKKGEKFEPRKVVLGGEINGYYIVSEGLKEGEEIAVSGTLFLKTKIVGVEEGGHAH